MVNDFELMSFNIKMVKVTYGIMPCIGLTLLATGKVPIVMVSASGAISDQMSKVWSS
jgi:hypothetical protein